MSVSGALAEIQEAINHSSWPGEEHLVRKALYNARRELEETPVIEVAVEAKK